MLKRSAVAKFGATLTAIFLAGGMALAQSGPRFEIRRFDAAGNTLLSTAEIEQALSKFTGANKEFADVRKAAQALEAVYGERGFASVQVTVPEQDVTGGVVKLRVIERRIGKVVVEGNKEFSGENVRHSLPTIKESKVPNADDVARNLQLVGEHPSKRTEVLLRAGASEDVVDATIRVSDEKPWKVSATLDNTGTGSTGYYRLGLGYQHSNLFDRDQTLSAQVVTSPTEISKVSIYGAGYKIPFYDWNSSLELIAGYSNVNSGTVAGLFSVAGSGSIGIARWNWILPRWGDLEQKLTAGLDYRAFRNKVLFEGQSIVPDVTIHPFSLGYSALRRFADAELSFYGTASTNIPGGNDGTQAAFDASRAGATAHYSILRYGASYVRQLGGDWQGRAVVSGQYTGNALVSGEQYGLGGPDSVRAYALRDAANDRGYSGQFEVYTPDVAKALGLADSYHLRFLGFVDAGQVQRNHALPGEQVHTTLGSFGAGVRWAYGKSANLRFDLGQTQQASPSRSPHSWRADAGLVLTF